MTGIAAILLSKGLPILAGALLNKAMDRDGIVAKIAEKLGLKKKASEPEIEEALEGMTYDQLQALGQYDREIEIEKEVTERLRIDNNSDSWFTKHVRPIHLTGLSVFWLTYMTVTTFFVDNIEKFPMAESFGGSIMTVLIGMYTFYFGGRTWEKNMRISRGSAIDE